MHRGIARHQARLGDIAREQAQVAREDALEELGIPSFRAGYDARDLVEGFNDGLSNAEIAAELAIALGKPVNLGSMSVHMSYVRTALRRALAEEGGAERAAEAMAMSVDELRAFVNTAGGTRVASLLGEARRLVRNGVTDNQRLITEVRAYAEIHNKTHTETTLNVTASRARSEAGLVVAQAQITDGQRAEIIALRKDGVGPTEITERTGHPMSLIGGVLARAKAGGEEFPALVARRSEEGLFGKLGPEDEPQYSRGDGRNDGDSVGSEDGRRPARDPFQAPEFQARVGRIQESLERTDASPARGQEPGARSGDDASAKGRASEAQRNVRDEDAPDAGLAQQTRDVLTISGIHIARKPAPKGSAVQTGAFRASVDSPIDLPPRLRDALLEAPEARSHNANIDFDVVEGGKNVADPGAREGRADGVYLRWTSIPDALRGSGLGTWLYRQVIDWAHRRGLSVYSDASISKNAWAMYARRLPELGYDMEKIHFGETFDAGFYEADDLTSPIWAVRPSQASHYDAAPIPREDYQIDGPTLRERQQAIEEARKAQEAFDKLPPHEQVMQESPDEPMFSFGQRRGVSPDMTAREMMELLANEKRQAAELRKGFEAAARCAARHGAQAAGTLVIPLGGTAADVLIGQVLGMTTAIPLGVTATPYLAQAAARANPNSWIARQRLANSHALAIEGMHNAGEMAGLDDPSSFDVGEGTPYSEAVGSELPADALDEGPAPLPEGYVKPGQSVPEDAPE